MRCAPLHSSITTRTAPTFRPAPQIPQFLTPLHLTHRVWQRYEYLAGISHIRPGIPRILLKFPDFLSHTLRIFRAKPYFLSQLPSLHPPPRPLRSPR